MVVVFCNWFLEWGSLFCGESFLLWCGLECVLVLSLCCGVCVYLLWCVLLVSSCGLTVFYLVFDNMCVVLFFVC